MSLFRNKYRNETTRLPDWDYSSPGAYFVTICTKDRTCWLSDIADGTIKLSKIGAIIQEEWENTAIVRPNIILDACAIMPNHFHGIIIITEKRDDIGTGNDDASVVGTIRRSVGTTRRVVPTKTLKPGSLGSIIGQFKSVCTKRIWADGFYDFAWQSRFYESIIRNEIQQERVRQYIKNNPYKWESDENNPNRIKK